MSVKIDKENGMLNGDEHRAVIGSDTVDDYLPLGANMNALNNEDQSHKPNGVNVNPTSDEHMLDFHEMNCYDYAYDKNDHNDALDNQNVNLNVVDTDRTAQTQLTSIISHDKPKYSEDSRVPLLKSNGSTDDYTAETLNLESGLKDSKETDDDKGNKDKNNINRTKRSMSRAQSCLEDPPDGGWGWVVTFSAFMVGVILDGISFSFGLFFKELYVYFNESKSLTSWIISVLNGTYLGIGK